MHRDLADGRKRKSLDGIRARTTNNKEEKERKKKEEIDDDDDEEMEDCPRRNPVTTACTSGRPGCWLARRTDEKKPAGLDVITRDR